MNYTTVEAVSIGQQFVDEHMNHAHKFTVRGVFVSDEYVSVYGDGGREVRLTGEREEWAERIRKVVA